jgi:hypothetical protein
MIKKDTDKILIIHCPEDAGSEALINCLALSKDFLLRDFNGPRDIDKKYLFLKNKIDTYKIGETFSTSSSNLLELTDYKKLNDILNSGSYIPIETNDDSNLQYALRIFPNAKVLQFTNFDKFIFYKKYQDIIVNYNTIKGIDWPDRLTPMFEGFPTWVLKEIQKNYKEFYDRCRNCVISENFATEVISDYVWDAESFTNTYLTVHNLSLLYDKLGLTDFNLDRVTYFYTKWKTKVYDPIMDECYKISRG